MGGLIFGKLVGSLILGASTKGFLKTSSRTKNTAPKNTAKIITLKSVFRFMTINYSRKNDLPEKNFSLT